MALGSQSTLTQKISGLLGLAHEIFTKGVKWHVRAKSPTSQMFKKAQKKVDYKVQGEALVGAIQIDEPMSAMATSGKLPNHVYVDSKQWSTTAIRRYRRIAQDNFTVRQASGDGAFQDLGSMILDQLWYDWGKMEIRHSIGDSRGYLCLTSSRVSQTSIVVKDGYGHTGCHPLLHIVKGQAIAWLDASNSFAVGGAGKVSTVTVATKTLTFVGNFDDGSTTVAAGDPIVSATSASTSDAHFETEYGNAPHGIMGLADPDGNFTTVLGLAESGNDRWKPMRESSVTFDGFELSDHFRKLKAYSTEEVTASSHTCITQAAVMSELARTVQPYMQQQSMGKVFDAGYQGVRLGIPGGGTMEFMEDDYFLQDVIVTMPNDDLYRADLDGDADFYAEDGSQWSRLPDEDAQEAFVREYMQTWTPRRNRIGVLKGISLPNVNEDDFTPVPR